MIEGLVETGNSTAHLRRPTMHDVAKLAGVSLKTVSRVVNHVPTVDEELAARVTTACDELGFRSNYAASILRSGTSTGTIGLLIKDLSNEFYATIASAAADIAHTNGTQLITAHSGENAADELEVIYDLCRRRVDGLLIVPTGGDHSALAAEIDRGTPIVFLDRKPVGVTADSVVIDNHNGAYDGAMKLIREGHRRVAVIIDTLKMPTMLERLNGVKAAFRDAGLPFDESLVAHNVRGPQEAQATTVQLLNLSNPPSAFFTGNNRSTIGTLAALWSQGRKEALVGFDDFQLSELMPRPLSVIRYDNRAIGSQGAELLFRRIRGESFPAQDVVLPTELWEAGNSTTGGENDQTDPDAG